MITYVIGDLFQSPAQVLVNTVNTVGVMGRGIAKEFKRIYPEMFEQYQKLCERTLFDIGQLYLHKTPYKWILNFPTKKDWRQPSKVEYIERGLTKFVNFYTEMRITSISFPLLGCGNGELNWEKVVRPLMKKYLKNLPVDVFIHLHQRDPFVAEHRNIETMKRWLRSEPESLTFTEVWDDICTAIKEQQQFRKLNDEKITFTTAIVKEPEIGIEINNSIFISQEALLDLWQHIRGRGFCTEDTMPSGLDQYSDYIITLMAQLEYIRPVHLSEQYSSVTQTIGLRSIPRLKESTGTLFSQTKVEEVQPV